MINLSRMQMLIRHEQRLKRRYDRVLTKATRITSQLTGLPRGTGDHSQVEDGAVELAEIDEVYREVFEELQAMRTELEQLLPALVDPDDIGIMRLRYIIGHYPEEIPEIVHLSRRAMFYHLAGAERKLMRMFPEQVMK